MATTSDLPSPFLDPSLQADYQAALKKRQLAQQLMGAFQQTNQTNPGWNNMALVPRRGALQNVASLVTALGAGKFSRDADKASEDYLQKYNAPEQAAPVAQAAPPVAAAPGVLPDPNAPAAGPAPVAPAASQNKMIPDGMDRRTAQMLVGTLGPAEYTKQFLAPNFKLSDFDKDLRAAGIRPNTPEYAQALQDKIYKDTQVGPIHANAGDVLLDPKTHLPVATVASNRAHTAEGMFVDPAGKYYDADGKPLDDAQVQDRILKFTGAKAKATADGRRTSTDATTLSDEAVNFAAERMLNGEEASKVLANFGRGAQGASDIRAVQNRYAKLATERGIDPADMATRIQELNAERRTRTELGAREGKMAPRVQEALNFAQVAKQASAAVPRGSFVPWNKLSQMTDTQLSDPALAKLHAATLSLINAYAAAVGGGTPTVHDKEEASKILGTAQGPEAYNAVVDQLILETQQALAAPKQVMEQLRKDSTGKTGQEHPKDIADLLGKYGGGGK